MSAETAFSKFFVKKGDAYVRLYWVYIILQLVALAELLISLVLPLVFLLAMFVVSGASGRVTTIIGMVFIILLSAVVSIPLGILCFHFPVRIAVDATQRVIIQQYALGFRKSEARFDEFAEIQLTQPTGRWQIGSVILCFAQEHKKRWYPFSNQIYLIFGRNRHEMREVAEGMQKILGFDGSKLRVNQLSHR